MDGPVIILRWLQFAAATGLFGLSLFQLYSPASGERAGRRSTLVLAASGLIVLASPAGLIAQTAVMAGGLAQALDPTALSIVTFQMGLGQAHLVRASLGLLSVILIVAGVRGRLLWSILLTLGLGVCATFPWSGHAGATEGQWGLPHRLSDAAHVMAAGAWIGALFAFLTLVAQGATVDRQSLYRALAQFAGVGTLTVVVLTLTGLINSWVLIGSESLPTALGTTYGGLLAIKLAAFAAMLGLAAINQFRLTPALGRAEGETATQAAVRRLRQSLVLETALGLIVLALAAALGTQAPPASLI